MAIVRSEGRPVLTAEDYAQIAAIKDSDIDTSDIPELTHEQFVEGRRRAILWHQAAARRKRRMFSLRLMPEAIQWWKSFGKGYTNIMTRMLELACDHPDWVEESLKPTRGRIPVLPPESRR